MKKKQILIITFAIIILTLLFLKVYSINTYNRIDLLEISKSKYSDINFNEVSPDLLIGVETSPNNSPERGGSTIYFLYKYHGFKKPNTYFLTYDYSKFLMGDFNYKTLLPQSVEMHHPTHASQGELGWCDNFGLKSEVVIVKFELENRELYLREEETEAKISLVLNDVDKYIINFDEIGITKVTGAF